MATNTNSRFPSATQVPDHAILDQFNKQCYLGNQFILPINTTAIASTSETPFVLFNNPLANTKSLFINYVKISCVTASQNATLRFYSTPTVTSAGTPATPVNLRVASNTTSVATVTTSPSISANGTLLYLLASSAFVPDSASILSIFDPGGLSLVTIQMSNNPTSFIAEIGWFEL